MRSWLLDLLRCPGCGSAPLEVLQKHRIGFLDTGDVREEVLIRGVLACSGCAARYPVLDESPRLLAETDLTPGEGAVLSARARGRALRETLPDLTPEQIQDLTEQTILDDYGRPASGTGLRMALEDIAYQRTYADRRVEQLRVVASRLASAPHTLVDVGGGSGGNARAAAAVFRPRTVVVADLSPRWPSIFRSGDRRVAYVRCRADALPFRDGSADLILSSFLLEHVSAWREILGEISRVGREAFVAFGPNRRFPYEFGHIDAPLAHCLPPRYGAWAAYLWARFRHHPRTYARLRQILDGMNYLSSREFFAYCQASGVDATNLFGIILQSWAAQGSDGLRGWLRRHPRITSGIGRSVEGLGAEPNVYALLHGHSKHLHQA